MENIAVWKLDQPHYINVKLPHGQPVQWEHKEQIQGQKNMARVMFDVPMLLDPKDSSDHNHPEGIIVARAKHPMYPKAYIYDGPPTPDMTPLTEGARQISEETKKNWVNPIDNLGDGGYAEGIGRMFEKELNAAFSKHGVPTGAVPIGDQVSKAEFDELKSDFQKLMEANAALMAQLAEKPQGARKV